MRIQIDEGRCTGHGRCYGVAPELFEPDDAGRGVVTSPEVPAGHEEAGRRAAGSCPEQAISLDG